MVLGAGLNILNSGVSQSVRDCDTSLLGESNRIDGETPMPWNENATLETNGATDAIHSELLVLSLQYSIRFSVAVTKGRIKGQINRRQDRHNPKHIVRAFHQCIKLFKD